MLYLVFGAGFLGSDKKNKDELINPCHLSMLSLVFGAVFLGSEKIGRKE